MEAPDLVAALEQVVAEVKQTQHRIADGFAVTGAAGLQRIRYIAQDALTEARDEEQEHTAA